MAYEYKLPEGLLGRSRISARKAESSLDRLDRLAPALREKADAALDAVVAARREQDDREAARKSLRDQARAQRERGLT